MRARTPCRLAPRADSNPTQTRTPRRLEPHAGPSPMRARSPAIKTRTTFLAKWRKQALLSTEKSPWERVLAKNHPDVDIGFSVSRCYWRKTTPMSTSNRQVLAKRRVVARFDVDAGACFRQIEANSALRCRRQGMFSPSTEITSTEIGGFSRGRTANAQARTQKGPDFSGP